MEQGWLRRISAQCWRYRRNVLLALGASLAGMGITALVPLVPRLIIDDVIVRHTQPLAPWATVLIAAAVAVYLMTYVRRYYGGRLALDVQHDLRTAMFDSIVRLDGARQDELDTGQVVGRATSDLQLIQGLLFMLPMMIGNLLMFVVSLVVMAVLSPLLTVIALAIAPALWFLANRSRTRLFPATWYAQGQAAAVAGVVDGAVTGVRVVKGFGQEAQEETKLRDVSRRLFAARMRTVRLNARYNPALQAVPSLGQVAMLALGGWMAVRGQISLGTFVAFSTYLAQLTGPVRMLTIVLTVGQQARAGVERVFELIDTEPTLEDGSKELPADAPATVEFDHVTFGYSKDRPVLDGFDLTVAPGETVAVVGASGSGKSTVSLLLPRLYDVTAGAVLVGGTDVRELTFDSLRSVIGMVPEERRSEGVFLDRSIDFNINIASLDSLRVHRLLPLLRLREAQRRSQIAADGVTVKAKDVRQLVGALSGGNQQKVAIARWLIDKPRVLILDEPSRGVDVGARAEVHRLVRELAAQGTAVLAISSDNEELVALCDRVVVMAEGTITGELTGDDITIDHILSLSFAHDRGKVAAS